MIDRYTLPEMAAVWDERVKLALWVKIEVEAVKAWAALGSRASFYSHSIVDGGFELMS